MAEAREIGFRFDAIPPRLAAMLLVIRREKSFAVARTAAVVDAQHRVPVIGQILHQTAGHNTECSNHCNNPIYNHFCP